MNRYLKCPRMYFYNDILNLSARADIPDSANYGTAFHETCRKFIEEAVKNGYPTKEQCLQIFKEEMALLPFSTPQVRKNFEGRGIKELSECYHHFTDVPIERVLDVEIKIDDKEDAFKGSIDRVEKNADGTYTIIDYKTSDPKNCINEISWGKAHEDYYNQICLYKYYFEKLTGNKVSKMAFFFPLDGTVIEVCPTNEEFQNVIEHYKNMREDILNHKFEPTDKEDSCKYCAYLPFCSFNRV